MSRNFWLVVGFALALLSGCKQTSTATFTDEIMGVWKPKEENGLMTLSNANGKLQLLVGEVYIPLTVGEVDTEQQTMSLNVTAKDGNVKVWTLQRVWNKERTAFTLLRTLHDGEQAELTFVRKITDADLATIARLAPQPAVSTSVASAAAEVVPAVEAPPVATAEPAPPVDAAVADPLAQYTVSFDCAKASIDAEKTVCTDPALGRLDGLLEATFRSRHGPEFGADAEIMKREQRAWLQIRDACKDASCMQLAYRERIKDLCGMAVVFGVHADSDCDKL